MSNEHWAIKNPVTLYAAPLGFDGKDWMLCATDAEGRQLTIVASRERFADALMGRGLQRMSDAEQVREMFIRDEVSVEVFERELEREMRSTR